MINFVNKNKNTIIRTAFIIPILLVAIISISHVVKWYNLANPINWAIYLSIAIEVAAMSAIAASAVRVKGISVWFIFIIVTLIQFIGNIFYSYQEIDQTSKGFLAWVELTQPIFEMLGDDSNSIIAQKRLLAFLEGGLLPLISLTCLHFFIQYDVKQEELPVTEPSIEKTIDIPIESIFSEPTIDIESKIIKDSEWQTDETFDEVDDYNNDPIQVEPELIEDLLDDSVEIGLEESIEIESPLMEAVSPSVDNEIDLDEILDNNLSNQLSSTKKITAPKKNTSVSEKMKRIRKL